MEYERIHKLQILFLGERKFESFSAIWENIGVLVAISKKCRVVSPSKLRLKQLLIASQRKKQGPNPDSSSKPLDSELINNTFLLAPNQASSFACNGGGVDSLQSKGPVIPKADPANSSSVHPVRMGEDYNLDNDSSGSSERSRWNDAEKWIMSKQYLKKAGSISQPAEETKEVPGIRFKGEEIRIYSWESQQKVRLEAKMRKIEAQIEQMRAQAQAKMVKKVALASQKSEEKRCLAEASKSRLYEKTGAQAEYIRQTGRIPSSTFHCCGWLE